MLARIKALKEEEEAKAKAAGKVVAPPVDVPKKAANKTITRSDIFLHGLTAQASRRCNKSPVL